MKWDNESAINFLQEFRPKGPWVLTYVKTKERKTAGKIFTPGDEEQLSDWLDARGRNEENVYFHVNQVLSGGHLNGGKASREQISFMDHLHVDIDPRAGENVHEEQVRILDQVSNMPGDLPQPNWVIFSGGGYQMFWSLNDPVEIRGNVQKAEDAKRYNLQLERLFDADHCHNIDRIMRLPGTINVPNAKKLAKGRTKQLARVVARKAGGYDLSNFLAAEDLQVDTGFASTTEVKISGNIPPIEDIDQVSQWAIDNGHVLKDWVKVVIVQGSDPEEPLKYESGSEALFAVVCELSRCELTDDQIYSIITDPDLGVAKSVLNKGTGVDRYAKRQIERAREHSLDPLLLEMNEKHAVIEAYGNRCIVIQEQFDQTMGRDRLIKQGVYDFNLWYTNKKKSLGMVNKVEKFITYSKWWFEHPGRREYKSIIFSPGKNVPKHYNLWRGFSCEAIPGDCSLYLRHVLENICQGNQEHYEYLISWMARAVQHPDLQGETAIILRGLQGTGKGLFISTFGDLFGRHFMQVADSKHLVGNFNHHLQDCVVLFGDEAFFAGDKKHEGTLKTLVTEKYLAIEAKNVDVQASPNYIHLMMASNNNWVVPAGMEERRFFVLDVGGHQMQNTSYFKQIVDQMASGGKEALLHMLMTRKLDGFQHRSVPATDALLDQKHLSMSDEHAWWYEKLVNGSVLQQKHNGEWVTRFPKAALHHDYVEYMQDCAKNHRMAPNVFAKFLKGVLPPTFPKAKRERIATGDGESARLPVFLIPDLKTCRDFWEDSFFKGDWLSSEDSGPSAQPF